MKIRVTSRSGEDAHESLEVPDDTEGFLRWLSEHGTMTVWAPGKVVNDWGGHEAVDRYTVHLVDEYD